MASRYREIKNQGDWVKKVINTDMRYRRKKCPDMRTNSCDGCGNPLINAETGMVIEVRKRWESTICGDIIWAKKEVRNGVIQDGCEICGLFLNDLEYVPEELFRV